MRCIVLLSLLVPCVMVAQPPAGYYDAAGGLSGAPLREALHEIISPHSVLPNSAIWAAYELTDTKPDGTVWDIYSDVPGGNPPYVFQFVADQCGNYSGEGDCFNREHTFPQSWYNSAAPMSTDLFHLHPTDAWVNQQRGNLPYGRVGSVNWTSQNGSKRGSCNWPDCSGTVFEPIDAFKGDVARNFFYMLTRYLPLLSTWDCPMMADGEFLPWAESMLLAWHELDPVSDKETARNNMVYSLQGNRNPFIDRPDWASAIWGPFASVAEKNNNAVQLWYFDGELLWGNSSLWETTELIIIDAMGRTVQETELSNESGTLRLDQLPSGIYLATLRNSRSSSSVRFIH